MKTEYCDNVCDFFRYAEYANENLIRATLPECDMIKLSGDKKYLDAVIEFFSAAHRAKNALKALRIAFINAECLEEVNER